MTTNKLQTTPHHVQQELCTTRPVYRQGKKLTAVKVYTVASESQHLFIYGVPKINLRNELKSLCTKYGQISKLHVVENIQNEMFTECYHVLYQRIQSARIAKRLLDNKSFYGGVLHVCYAPEHENIEELKYKLEQRRYDVLKRLHGDNISKPNFKEVTQGLNTYSENSRNNKKTINSSNKEINRKRKRPAVELTEKRMSEVDPMLAWKNVPKELDPRIKSTETGSAIPKKHYELNKNETKPNDSKKVKVMIKTKEVYGPQLPTNIILNHGNDYEDTKETKVDSSEEFTDGNKVLVPTQVVLSKEYVYNIKKTKNRQNSDKTKKFVFKTNAKSTQ